ncbi:MAG: recombination mediator RecR [Erysipelotrichaceae bacterium]
MYPKAFENLIEQLKHLPGVGSKTAERYAYSVLDWKQEEANAFIEAIKEIQSINYCEICGNLSEDKVCSICGNEERNKNIICVVQQPKDILAIEKSQTYKGVYHVLNGEISATKGIMPEDINIASLIERMTPTTQEVIIATNPTAEGETTALYIARLLEAKGINVTRIAHGIPMGGHLDYADELTLIKAMEGRKAI